MKKVRGMNCDRFRIAATFILLSATLMFYAGSTRADETPGNETSMFSQQWLDTVVSIEQLQPALKEDGTVIQDSNGKVKLVPFPIGTGFIAQTTNKHLVLITAKHVIADPANSTNPAKDNLVYRINQQEGSAYLLKDLQLEEKGYGKWFLSKTHDVACRFIEREPISKFRAITSSKFLPTIQLHTGANLLVLGFPMGLRSEAHPNPIARKGMVALADKDDLLIDAFVFPGNSGGPVLYEPPIKIAGKGPITSPFINEEHLVGLVTGFLPYKETAISQHTKRPRVVFEENSGLAQIVPADAIKELMNRDDVTKLDSLIEPK